MSLITGAQLAAGQNTAANPLVPDAWETMTLVGAIVHVMLAIWASIAVVQSWQPLTTTVKLGLLMAVWGWPLFGPIAGLVAGYQRPARQLERAYSSAAAS